MYYLIEARGSQGDLFQVVTSTLSETTDIVLSIIESGCVVLSWTQVSNYAGTHIHVGTQGLIHLRGRVYRVR